MTASVAVVTDSTACLPGRLAARYQIGVVPLGVVIGGTRFDDDAAGLPGRVIAEIGAGRAVSTASPGPERFAAAYTAAAARAAGIVSVHLSGSVSGTVDAARLAAAEAPVPVRVVDSLSLGLGLGFAVLAAAQAAAAGGGIEDVAAAAARRAARLNSFFAVATPDRLRAGGRLGPPLPPGPGTRAGARGPGRREPGRAAGPDAAARPEPGRAAGPVLAAGPERTAGPEAGLRAWPLLHIAGGRIELLDKTRTRSGAIRRLTELAIETAAEAAAGEPADLGVQFLGEPGLAAALAGQLAERVPGARSVCLARGDAVIAAHTGTGMLGVVVART
jgi:fatty acid-binding protein DegV